MSLTTLLLAGPVSAEMRVVELAFKSPVTPVKVAAVFMNGVQAFSDTEIELRQQSKDVVIASVRYDNTELPSTFSVYAVGILPNGEVATTAVKEVKSDADLGSIFTMPLCPPEEPDQSLQSQLSVLASLVKVRAERRDNISKQLSNSLSADFLKRMNSYEAGFGFVYNTPLSKDLHPVELSERLTRVLIVLQRLGKKRTIVPAQ